jgi:hypothetical protein
MDMRTRDARVGEYGVGGSGSRIPPVGLVNPKYVTLGQHHARRELTAKEDRSEDQAPVMMGIVYNIVLLLPNGSTIWWSVNEA